MAKKPRYAVITGDVGQDYIQIRRGTKEVLYWDKQEWIDEPEIVITIVNAVALAVADPEMMDVKLREMGILK